MNHSNEVWIFQPLLMIIFEYFEKTICYNRPQLIKHLFAMQSVFLA